MKTNTFDAQVTAVVFDRASAVFALGDGSVRFEGGEFSAAHDGAILPSPRRYDAASPGPYVRRRASRVQAAMGTVRDDGLAACVLG